MPLTNDNSKILSTKIHSRHISLKECRVYIRFTPVTDSTTELRENIKCWYCECKNGARTLGCCCHVAAVIYYLSYARHANNQNLKKPAFILNSIFPENLSTWQDKT